MEKINIAKLLKDCPQGMELDCTMYEDCKFLDVEAEGNRYLLRITTPCGIKYLDKYGCYTTSDKAKCIIFPKGKTTWEGFVPPCKFKNGDIVSTIGGGWIGIVKKPFMGAYETYITIFDEIVVNNNNVLLYFDRLATEEEKQKLFKAIKERGYKWNPETKTLEKFVEPKFKVGDIVQYITDSTDRRKIEEIDTLCNMYHTDSSPIMFEVEDEWKSVLNSENVEQNLSDEFEPKFHKGDWIVFNGLTLYVKEVVKGFYRTISKGGISNSYDWDIDKIARLWTIQDAKDGDVLAEDSCIFIIQKIGDNCTAAKTHCILYDDGDFDDGSILYFDIDSTKLATEEEKQKLFKAIKDNDYKWNAETKTLEKIIEPKFKVGDRIKHIVGREEIATVVGVGKLHYNLDSKVGTSSFSISLQREWELVTNKFDINTLIPFESRVLVRDHNCYEWEGEIFTRYAKSFNNSNFVTLGGESWKQCIPYNDDTKHLLGTTDDCEEYYKNWCNV